MARWLSGDIVTGSPAPQLRRRLLAPASTITAQALTIRIGAAQALTIRIGAAQALTIRIGGPPVQRATAQTAPEIWPTAL